MLSADPLQTDRFLNQTVTVTVRIPLLPNPVRWLVPLAVAGLICYWSLVTTPPTSLSLESTVSSTEPTPAASGLSLELSTPHVRHAVAYATLTLALAYALVDRELPIHHKAVLVFSVATGYGAMMEIGQLFQPDRTASILDVMINAVGSTIGLAWYGLEQRAQFTPLFERNG